IEIAAGHLFQSLLHDEAWLMRAAGLSKSEARSLARGIALHTLHDFRRACTAYLYHAQTLDGDHTLGGMEELHMELFSKAVGVAPNGIDALLGIPNAPEFGAELRGWQASALLGDEMVSRFDVDWYRNPRSG